MMSHFGAHDRVLHDRNVGLAIDFLGDIDEDLPLISLVTFELPKISRK